MSSIPTHAKGDRMPGDRENGNRVASRSQSICMSAIEKEPDADLMETESIQVESEEKGAVGNDVDVKQEAGEELDSSCFIEIEPVKMSGIPISAKEEPTPGNGEDGNSVASQSQSIGMSAMKEELEADIPMETEPIRVEFEESGAFCNDVLVKQEAGEEEDGFNFIKEEPVVVVLPEADIVSLLLETPFRRWSEELKRDILSSKPTPIISKIHTEIKKGKVFTRSFKESWYQTAPWLCGSAYKESLFCWPCLLLSNTKSPWNTTGYFDLKNLSRAIKNHDGSLEHLGSAWAFHALSRRTVHEKMPKQSLNKEKYNEKVRLNRLLMAHLIDAVLFLATNDLPFWGHQGSLNKGNYVEIVNLLLSRASPELQIHHESVKNVFIATSKTIQNELMECAAVHVRDVVEQEIKLAKFFSVQVDDTTDMPQKSQCSIIVRFINETGVPTERFLGFHDVIANHDESLFDLVDSVLTPFDYPKCLVAQCYDGALVMNSMNGLQAKISAKATLAFFVHSMAHRLNLVLQHSCYVNEICRRYFLTLSGIPAFFHRSPKRSHILSSIVNRQVPPRWSSKSILTLIVDNWSKMRDVFEAIMKDKESSDAFLLAQAYKAQFENFEYHFMSLIFDDIFNLTDDLCLWLQKNALDVQSCISKIKNVTEKISSKRNEGKFEELFATASSETAFPKQRGVSDDQKQKYKSIFFEIVDIIINQLNTRFADFEKLDFLKLADPKKFAGYVTRFPSPAFDGFIETYGELFEDPVKLKNELKIVYGVEGFREFEPFQILARFREDGGCGVLPEAYKFFCLAVTIPSTSASAERSFSCLKRIESYLKSTSAENRLSSLAMLSIEKDVVRDLKAKGELYDPVINKFARLKDRELELIYKT